MNHSLNDQVLCFAGLFQAASLVKRTANIGRKIDYAVDACINSLFVIDAESVEQIYGGSAHLRLGLETLIKQIGQAELRDIEITRYAITLIHLEKKLSRQQPLLTILEQGIDTAKSQAEYFSCSHDNVIGNLADLYQKTISTITPKIIVTGDESMLRMPANAMLIRTLLLTGIRSAMAWRQCGGSRWQLLFKRKAILNEAKAALDNLPRIDTVV